MSARVWFLTAVALLVMLVNAQRLPSQDDVADISSQELRANKDETKRYFLIGLQKGVQAPKEGYGLLVVLPGGAGSADFHPFVKRIYKNALPEGYLVAQPVAVKWTEQQQIVWPTDKNRAEEMKFSTEDFVDAVIKDVTSWHKVNPERIFTLSWSSSGQAAYAVSLTSKKVTGSSSPCLSSSQSFFQNSKMQRGTVTFFTIRRMTPCARSAWLSRPSRT
jgi:poly(3-hydroxybutyrate) depolymerase